MFDRDVLFSVQPFLTTQDWVNFKSTCNNLFMCCIQIQRRVTSTRETQCIIKKWLTRFILAQRISRTFYWGYCILIDTNLYGPMYIKWIKSGGSYKNLRSKYCWWATYQKSHLCFLADTLFMKHLDQNIKNTHTPLFQPRTTWVKFGNHRRIVQAEIQLIQFIESYYFTITLDVNDMRNSLGN